MVEPKVHSKLKVRKSKSKKSRHNYLFYKKMAKSSGLVNAPSTTGNPSGGGRGNNSSGTKGK